MSGVILLDVTATPEPTGTPGPTATYDPTVVAITTNLGTFLATCPLDQKYFTCTNDHFLLNMVVLPDMGILVSVLAVVGILIVVAIVNFLKRTINPLG